jgi:DNA invertase Pin-like site-specific DNA recombinase
MVRTTSDVGKLVITIMSGIAEFERKLILSRTEAGITKAREQGKKFGRPSALGVGQRRKIAERYAAGETMQALADDRSRRRQHTPGATGPFRSGRVKRRARGRS